MRRMKDLDVILAMDTALAACGVCARARARDVRVMQLAPMVHGQAEHLLPMVEAVMAESDVPYKDLSAIVTTVGPGAFTGLRVGLSTAKTLAITLDIPLFGITTLQALASEYVARSASGEGFAVVLETKRQDFYVQAFDAAGAAVDEAAVRPIEELRSLYGDLPVIGDGVERYMAAVPDVRRGADMVLIDPGYLSDLFFDRRDLFVLSPDPLYLREADVSAPKTPRRILV
jgi:tRNA threonylcarbamoyladenosine biosynthesis protein TsaB